MERYEYLAHHGIKGMKWGVRKYQNEDGSLTIEGKRRYNINTESRTVQAVDPVDRYAKPKTKENPYSARRTVKIHKAREKLSEAARAKNAADMSGNKSAQRRIQRRLNRESDRYLKATKDPSRKAMHNYAYLMGPLGLSLTRTGRNIVRSYVRRNSEVQYRAMLEAKIEVDKGYEYLKDVYKNHEGGVLEARPDRY